MTFNRSSEDGEVDYFWPEKTLYFVRNAPLYEKPPEVLTETPEPIDKLFTSLQVVSKLYLGRLEPDFSNRPIFVQFSEQCFSKIQDGIVLQLYEGCVQALKMNESNCAYFAISLCKCAPIDPHSPIQSEKVWIDAHKFVLLTKLVLIAMSVCKEKCSNSESRTALNNEYRTIALLIRVSHFFAAFLTQAHINELKEFDPRQQIVPTVVPTCLSKSAVEHFSSNFLSKISLEDKYIWMTLACLSSSALITSEMSVSDALRKYNSLNKEGKLEMQEKEKQMVAKVVEEARNIMLVTLKYSHELVDSFTISIKDYMRLK